MDLRAGGILKDAFAGGLDMAHSKRMRALRRFAAPLALALLGAFAFLALVLLGGDHAPLAETDADLRTGGVAAVSFQARRSELHELRLEMDHGASSGWPVCAAGMRHPVPEGEGAETCRGAPVAVTWTLSSGRHELARGSYPFPGQLRRSYAATETVALHLGWARLEAGRSYTVIARSAADATMLAQYRPRLVVRRDPVVVKGEAVLRTMGQQAALAVAAAGLVWLAVAWLIMRFRQVRRQLGSRLSPG